MASLGSCSVLPAARMRCCCPRRCLPAAELSPAPDKSGGFGGVDKGMLVLTRGQPSLPGASCEWSCPGPGSEKCRRELPPCPADAESLQLHCFGRFLWEKMSGKRF